MELLDINLYIVEKIYENKLKTKLIKTQGLTKFQHWLYYERLALQALYNDSFIVKQK